MSTFSSSHPLYFSFNNILYKTVPTQCVTNPFTVLVLMNVQCTMFLSSFIIHNYSFFYISNPTDLRNLCPAQHSITVWVTKCPILSTIQNYATNVVFPSILLKFVGQDSSVAIATRCGPEVPGIESQWGEIFCTRPTGPGVYPTSYTMGTGSFTGVKRPRLGVHHPPHLAPMLKEE